MAKKLTQEEFVRRLDTLNGRMSLVGQFIKIDSKVEVECKSCKHVWKANPRDLIFSNSGCPKCYGHELRTHQEFLSDLEDHQIAVTPLENYVDSTTKILVRCNKDMHEWLVRPNDLFSGYGCPKCGGRVAKTTEEFVSELSVVNPNVLVVGEYLKANAPIAVKCKVDGYKWSPPPSRLLRGSGCPKCAQKGFDPTKEAVFYVYEFGEFCGFGISNSFARRHSSHLTSFRKAGLIDNYRLTRSISGSGEAMRDLEKLIIKSIDVVSSGIVGFKKECTLVENSSKIYAIIDNYEKVTKCSTLTNLNP